MTRMIKVGAGMIKEYNALRLLADNLEQIERLQSTNKAIWRGLAEAVEGKTNEQQAAQSIKGAIGNGQAVGPGSTGE